MSVLACWSPPCRRSLFFEQVGLRSRWSSICEPSISASALFSLYVSNFAHYDKTYGPLGAVIGLMMWVYVSTIVVLAGAELNSEIEHQTTVDTTVGAPRPMGLRRAKMADTIGAAHGA